MLNVSLPVPWLILVGPLTVIPTALPMVAQITTPYRASHPDVQFTIWSRTSIEILDLLDNLEIDAGITYLDNEPVGRVSSGAYAHHVQASLALGYIKTPYVKPGAEFDVAILGKPHRAKLLDAPLFDPKGARLRG